MIDDTSSHVAPEGNPGSESGKPEPAVETFDGNIEVDTCQTVGAVDAGKPNSEPLQPADNKDDAENEIAARTTVSERKLAANRQNATHSTGPKTAEGKAASSRNAISHGIFASKLFSLTAAGAIERREYEELGTQLVEHFQPVGFKEELLVAQIFAELVRQGRILHFEEEVLSRKESFFTTSGLEKVVKYFACHSRELARLFQELEAEQFNRKSQSLAGTAPKAEQPQSPGSTAVTLEGAPEAK
ncbi:MAG: hypothetical protein ABSA32_08000 [Candidatus Acidiferrales bacterium]|jgi:hypothetical protein